MRPILVILLLAFVTGVIEAKPNVKTFFKKPIFKDFYGIIDADLKVGDAGEPLILTDLIHQNKIEEAQKAAEVNFEDFLGVKSYAGYFKVDETFDTNLFFWFFKSQSNAENDPVILWLQGGPGAPSEYGLFQENGPFYFVSNNQLALRNTTWTRSNSVLYIDQPAGTGFSFTKGGYAQNQTKVGDDLYEALSQFFKLFPNLQSNDFFIVGESYGGKYVPATAYSILKKNPSNSPKINLKGLGIGNGLTDPKYQLRYAEYMYQHGLIDSKTKRVMEDTENEAVDNIKLENWQRASELMNSDFITIDKASALPSLYNYLETNEADDDEIDMGAFLAREDVRRALHTGNTPFNDGQVYENLALDIPKSVAPLVSELLDHYRILIYNGQLDVMVAYPMTIDYLQNLQFRSAEEYKNAERKIWYFGENRDVAGYIKTAGNLTEVLVRNSGHMVPSDKPEWGLELINKFLKNEL